MEYTNPETIEHTDATATLGFENAARNQVVVWQGDCPHCLLPFNRPNARSWSVKVYTENGLENWCESCAEEGIEEGICIKLRSLSKKERKQLRKYVKQQDKQTERIE